MEGERTRVRRWGVYVAQSKMSDIVKKRIICFFQGSLQANGSKVLTVILPFSVGHGLHEMRVKLAAVT